MGPYIMGPAQRLEFREKSYAVVVSFSVPENVENLFNSFVMSNLEMNPPEVLLTKSKLEAHKAAVKERQQKPAAPDSDATKQSKQPYTPTDAQLFIMANLIMSAHPETYNLLSEANLQKFLEWLRIEMNWNVNDSRVKKLLLPRARFVSMGEIPVSPMDQANLEIRQQRYEAAIALPVRKKKEVKQPEEPWTEEQKKEDNKAEKLLRKRLAPPKQTNQDMLHSRLAFKQKEGVTVKMILHEDPNDRSYIRLRFTHLYKDESRATEQPSHKTDVDLTYRNTRPRGHLPKSHGDTYEPSERILDVSEKRFMPFLAKLFPHLTRDDKEYWNKLFQQNEPLTLLQFHQNELPMTSNVFTPRVDVPTSYDDLRIIMHRAPVIHVLVRGIAVDKAVNSIVKRFGQLARFDPLSRFFVDIHNPYIDNKGIEATANLPKFTTLPENAFEDWREFSVRCGVGTIIELRYGMSTQCHRGNASAHPVPHTQFTKDKKTIDMSLFLNFVEERPNKNTPRLTVGDHVNVDFNFDRILSQYTWKGRVVHPTLSTGIGQVCIIVERPFNEKDGLLDTKQYTTLSAKDMENMTPEELSNWASTNRNLNIVVIKSGTDKECKRLCNGLSNMVVPAKLKPDYEGKEHILSHFRTFLMCKDHSQYDRSSLFHTLHPEDRDCVLNALQGSLRDCQMEPINYWLNEGVASNIVALAGISGSGKTFTSISVLCGYTFRVRIDCEKRAMQEMDLVRLMKSQVAHLEKKTKHAATKDDFKSGKPDVLEGGNDDNYDDADDEAELMYAEEPVKEVCAGLRCSDNSTREFEAGRVTHVSIQNETVDHNYAIWCSRLRTLCRITGAPPKLVVRLHSVQSECKALLAMVDPYFTIGIPDDPEIMRINPELGGTSNMILLEHYLRSMRNEHPGITDKRFHAVEGSLAYVILQLARLPGIPLSGEVAITWTEQERDSIANELVTICHAYDEYEADGKISEDTRKQVKRAFKIGYHIIITRAPVVCSTLAVATTSSFQMHRKAHAIALEEAGRAIDSNIATLLSTHWACDLIMLVGDWRQLGFNPYGPELDNPFRSQLSRSTFSRLNYTGFPIQVLTHTSRFTSNPLLVLCGRLNNEPRICPVTGSFNAELEDQAKRINQKIWGKKSVVVVVNTENAIAQRDATGSWYCFKTAITTMHDMVHRLQHIQGDNLMVITPYNAQISLLLALRDGAHRNALASGDETLADQLTRVMIITVDSSMGKDREHVIFDSVGHADGFLWRQPRTLVAGTRARSSFVFVGPTFQLMSKTDVKDRLKDMLFDWRGERLFVNLNEAQLSKFEQYQTILSTF